MILTREQRRVVQKLLRNRSRDQIQTLGGFAGTGKTTSLRALAEALPGWAPCAFTGKAAFVLRQKGMAASTIHSLIYTAQPKPGGGVEFRLRHPCEMGCEGFLVDEASMGSRDLHDDLLSFGKPGIFGGGHGQLANVGKDVNLISDPTYRLETIHRNAGPIAHFAEHLRKGNPARSFHGDGAVRVVRTSAVTDRILLRADQVI